MPSRHELQARRRVLVRTWESLLATGRPVAERGGADGSVSPLVLDSWRRSSSHAVRPDLAEAPVDRADEALAEWAGSRLAAGLRAAEADVRQVAQDGELVAAVTDGTGRIVWTAGSPVMQRSAERVNFVPGGRWDEASVGTNALALALRTGRPATVYSAEHYSAAVHGWVCYSVPLTDPHDGRVLGVLDLSTTWDRAHPLAMSAAAGLGRLVESSIPAQRSAREPAGVVLRVLGGREVRLGSAALVLPLRRVEVLLLLALHPDGLSLEQLHARLYGDAPTSTSTLKAEVSHLRSALDGGIASRPYRLTGTVDTDVTRLLAAVERADVAAAVALYAGPLLPESESPGLVEWRSYLEVAVREAVLGCADAGTVAAFADRVPYDEQVQQHLADLLPQGDPRRPLARARLHRAGCA